MRVLMMGGSGLVGSLILPAFREQYGARQIRILDVRPPDATVAGDCEYVAGSVTDASALAASLTGFGADDVLVYLVMGPGANWSSTQTVAGHFDAGVKGVYLALDAAVNAGVRHVVYSSSLSAYRMDDPARFYTEAVPPDATGYYGLTKRFGETICAAFCERVSGFSVNALRLCYPLPLAEWEARVRDDPSSGYTAIATAGPDVAAAYLAATRIRFGGFEAFHISGDASESRMRLQKAKTLLGWTPRHVRADAL